MYNWLFLLFQGLFKFKQFQIEDNRSAMKVGTDGTMLGCWVNTVDCRSVLDVGCGSGVLTAIIGQKNSLARIIGIDVEDGAISDAIENVLNLPVEWRDRIQIIQTRLQDFDTQVEFDLIVSNPPFFENSQISVNDKRNFARHTESLHYTDIFKFAKDHLSPKGKIAIVLPIDNAKEALKIAGDFYLHPQRICEVLPNPSKVPHRIMFEVGREEFNVQRTSLTIETGVRRHDYTEEYKELCREFYLYF